MSSEGGPTISNESKPATNLGPFASIQALFSEIPRQYRTERDYGQ